jgi:hypothetical protein
MEQFEQFIEGYSISNYGRIRNDITGYIRKVFKRRKKANYLSVSINGHNYDVHKWVALKFVPNPNNFPEVRHLDGNPENNIWTNLEWGTHKQNIEDSLKQGTHTSLTSQKFKKQQNEKGVPSKVKRTPKSGVNGIQVFHGVRKTRYRVYLNSGGSKYLGTFDSIEEAKEVHRKAYFELYGVYPQ